MGSRGGEAIEANPPVLIIEILNKKIENPLQNVRMSTKEGDPLISFGEFCMIYYCMYELFV